MACLTHSPTNTHIFVPPPIRLALQTKVERERLQIYGRLREEIGMEIYFVRPSGLRENAETAISCREPEPARKKRYTSSREEEENAQMCPCGKATESRTHAVGECEVYMEERDVSEEMRKIDE